MMALAWAATTRDQDFIRMEGLKKLANNSKHRKEIVAGGLSKYLTEGASCAGNSEARTELFNRISYSSWPGGGRRE
jgi:hypothetical protein